MIDVSTMLVNLSQSYAPLQQLITATAYLLGVAFGMKGIYSLKVYGEARTMMASHASIKTPLTYLLVAVVFLWLPTAVEVALDTFLGYDSVLGYEALSGPTSIKNSEAGRAILGFVQLVGLVAFIRGWIIIAKSSAQGAQGGMGKGISHILGGVLAFNIVGTMNIIEASLGISW